MNKQSRDDFLFSARELSAFELTVRTATTKGEATTVVRAYGLDEHDFVQDFSDLAKWVQGLPDDGPSDT